jgi:hypothetical protein
MTDDVVSKRPFIFIAKCYFSDKWYVIRNNGNGGEEKLHTAGSLEEARKLYEALKEKK